MRKLKVFLERHTITIDDVCAYFGKNKEDIDWDMLISDQQRDELFNVSRLKFLPQVKLSILREAKFHGRGYDRTFDGTFRVDCYLDTQKVYVSQPLVGLFLTPSQQKMLSHMDYEYLENDIGSHYYFDDSTALCKQLNMDIETQMCFVPSYAEEPYRIGSCCSKYYRYRSVLDEMNLQMLGLKKDKQLLLNEKEQAMSEIHEMVNLLKVNHILPAKWEKYL